MGARNPVPQSILRSGLRRRACHRLGNARCAPKPRTAIPVLLLPPNTISIPSRYGPKTISGTGSKSNHILSSSHPQRGFFCLTMDPGVLSSSITQRTRAFFEDRSYDTHKGPFVLWNVEKPFSPLRESTARGALLLLRTPISKVFRTAHNTQDQSSQVAY